MQNFFEKNKDLRKISLKNDYNPLDLFDGLPYNKSKGNVAENTFSFNLNQDDTSSGLSEKGTEIKNRVQSAVSNLFPGSNNKELFKDIDGATIEKNIPLAESVIEKNRASNSVNRNLFKNLTYLKDGLAMFYAAFEQGNYKAADMARKLAYTASEGLSFSTEPNESNKTQASNKRYVNADFGLNLRSEPGTSKQIIGKLSKGDEVEFTGNKTGKIGDHEWAEIKYGDKTGWVAADYLNTEMPYDMYVPGRPDNPQSEMPKQEKSDPQTNNKGAGTRYVGEKTINMRAVPGLRGHTKEKIDYGESVEFTGNKDTVNGIEWAEVKYKNKTGWVIADYLKTQRSPDMPYGVDLTDHQKIIQDFSSGKHPAATVYGDYDNFYGLQCVDATNWFINTYTTLNTTDGNGCQKVEKIADLKPDLEISEIPSAPAVYSIAPGRRGPGVANFSDSKAGHTGIVLDAQPNPNKEGEYILTVFHTYSSLPERYGKYCDIKKYPFVPNDGVTFVNIGNYVK